MASRNISAYATAVPARIGVTHTGGDISAATYRCLRALVRRRRRHGQHYWQYHRRPATPVSMHKTSPRVRSASPTSATSMPLQYGVKALSLSAAASPSTPPATSPRPATVGHAMPGRGAPARSAVTHTGGNINAALVRRLCPDLRRRHHDQHHRQHHLDRQRLGIYARDLTLLAQSASRTPAATSMPT